MLCLGVLQTVEILKNELTNNHWRIQAGSGGWNPPGPPPTFTRQILKNPWKSAKIRLEPPFLAHLTKN